MTANERQILKGGYGGRQVRMSMVSSMMLMDWVMERLEEEDGEEYREKQAEMRWGKKKLKEEGRAELTRHTTAIGNNFHRGRRARARPEQG